MTYFQNSPIFFLVLYLFFILGLEELSSAYSCYPDALLYMNYIILVGKSVCMYNLNHGDKIESSKTENMPSADTNKQKIDVNHYIIENSLTNSLSTMLLCSINLYNALKNNVKDESLDLYLSSLLKYSVEIDKNNWYISSNKIYKQD